MSMSFGKTAEETAPVVIGATSRCVELVGDVDPDALRELRRGVDSSRPAARRLRPGDVRSGSVRRVASAVGGRYSSCTMT
jgi:hypothetical protein